MQLVSIQNVLEAISKRVDQEAVLDKAAQSAIDATSERLRILLINGDWDKAKLKTDVFQLTDTDKHFKGIPSLRLSSGFVDPTSLTLKTAFTYSGLSTGDALTDITIFGEEGLVKLNAGVELTVDNPNLWLQADYAAGFDFDQTVDHNSYTNPADNFTETYANPAQVPDWLRSLTIDLSMLQMELRAALATGDVKAQTLKAQTMASKINDSVVTTKIRCNYDSLYHYSSDVA